MKHVLDAVDEQLALNAFFHASPTPLRVGAVLEARCPRKVNSYMKPIEDFVEKYRPEGENSRRCAMYSADNVEKLDELAPMGTHLYEVEPLGHVTRGDFAWIGGSSHYWGKDVEDAFLDMSHAKADALGWLKATRQDSLRRRMGYEPKTFMERIQAVRDYFEARSRAKEAAKNYWSKDACDAIDESYGDCPRQPEYLSPAIKIVRKL